MVCNDGANLPEILERIRRADSVELNEMLHAIQLRYHALFPEWETVYLALPTNNQKERKRCLEEQFEILQKQE